MSGTIQHYIPQSLLRCFGLRGKGKRTRVAVYERGNIFVTATTGAAAERYFYSRPSAAGERTLDDRITDYEPRLLEILQSIHVAPAGERIDAPGPAELIAHLCVRNAQMRESFTHAAGQVLSGAVDMFMDPVKRWKLMGLDKPKPTGVLLEEFDKLYDTMGLVARGVPRDRFAQMCFETTKAKFDPATPMALPEIAIYAQTMNSALADVAASSQRRAMERDLAPEARMAALRTLSWAAQDTNADLVLPDCIAINGTDNHTEPGDAFRVHAHLVHGRLVVARGPNVQFAGTQCKEG